MLETPFYIACLKLTGRKCLVVGGGDIGLEKVEGLLACGGDVMLIAPTAHPELERLASEGSIAWEKRDYAGPADLEGVFMVIACTDDSEVNIGIFYDAEKRAMLVNIVDVPPLCNFILPAIVRTGSSARSTRASRSSSTTPAAGRRARCRPIRTARSSSRGSSTATPTRSSFSATGASRRSWRSSSPPKSGPPQRSPRRWLRFSWSRRRRRGRSRASRAVRPPGRR
jgi:hypothetical protein